MVLGIDLGATKIAAALFNSNGLIRKEMVALDGQNGSAVGQLLKDVVTKFLDSPDGR
jgi:predicted NBD/HSP70 family sugar kinase